MRLIDADALMREFADYVRASNNSDFADVPTWNDAVSLLGSAPTIEAEPIKHGRWIDAYDLQGHHYMRCSECGTYIEATFFANDYSVIFCPNCGERMDEVEDGN